MFAPAVPLVALVPRRSRRGVLAHADFQRSETQKAIFSIEKAVTRVQESVGRAMMNALEPAAGVLGL
jgi:hypothetical protein